MTLPEFTTLKLERVDAVALVRLHRPEVLNALNRAMLEEFKALFAQFEADEGLRCVVITGSDKAFAAGADIKEMLPQSYQAMYRADYFADWACVAEARVPVIAAVAGYALGGGCELAMMCDFIIAADNAKFGQPEIKIGVMPGMGGSQRLTRFVGKSKAMDLCLTGRMMDATEAERCGLVSRVVPLERLVPEALEAAATIAGFSKPVAMLTKECVDRTYETTLGEGLRFERRLFHSLFALEDQREGMTAFVEKRPPDFKHR